MTRRRTFVRGLTAIPLSLLAPLTAFSSGRNTAPNSDRISDNGEPETDDSCDVLVIGGGGAGLSAAAAAAEKGAHVILLEKQAAVGGNTRFSGGFFAAVDPARQRRQGITDSLERFRNQIIENGGGRSDPVLAGILARGASEMLAYLEHKGMRFQDEVIEIYGAHWPRCHCPLLPNGEGYIRTMLGVAMEHGADIRVSSPVRRLLINTDGRVIGAEYRHSGGLRRVFARRGVVLASGGFGANRTFVEKVAPRLAGLTHNNTPGSTGEMLTEAARIGAELIDLAEIQCLPGCPPNRTHRVRLHNDVSRFIFVDQQGRRFIREDGRRDVLRDAVLGLPGSIAYSIVDDMGLRSYDILMQKEAVLGVETGDAWRADSVEELALAMGLDPAVLRRTVDTYNEGVRSGRDPFGKAPSELRHEIKTPPFWGCYAAMTVHYTMGGVRISPTAEVLNTRGDPIPGLWAAGEVTGGIHGVNRMGANGVNDALVFGRIAGQNAARHPAL